MNGTGVMLAAAATAALGVGLGFATTVLSGPGPLPHIPEIVVASTPPRTDPTSREHGTSDRTGQQEPHAASGTSASPVEDHNDDSVAQSAGQPRSPKANAVSGERGNPSQPRTEASPATQVPSPVKVQDPQSPEPAPEPEAAPAPEPAPKTPSPASGPGATPVPAPAPAPAPAAADGPDDETEDEPQDEPQDEPDHGRSIEDGPDR